MSFSSNERENMSKLQGSMSHGLTPLRLIWKMIAEREENEGGSKDG